MIISRAKKITFGDTYVQPSKNLNFCKQKNLWFGASNPKLSISFSHLKASVCHYSSNQKLTHYVTHIKYLNVFVELTHFYLQYGLLLTERLRQPNKLFCQRTGFNFSGTRTGMKKMCGIQVKVTPKLRPQRFGCSRFDPTVVFLVDISASSSIYIRQTDQTCWR